LSTVPAAWLSLRVLSQATAVSDHANSRWVIEVLLA